MQLGIIGGTGTEGRGIAMRLAAAGVPVILGSRSLDRAASAVAAILASAGTLPIEAATNGDAIERADVVVLSVPFECVGAVLDAHRFRFRQASLVIDVTVPLVFAGGTPSLAPVAEGSAAEFVRARLAGAVRLAATFKTIPASTLGRLDAPLDCDEFVCGDSIEARDAAVALLARIPTLRPLDAGGLDAARTLERMTALAITLNKRYKARAARFRVVGLPPL
jgi:NADPH-dependent F420 reductase